MHCCTLLFLLFLKGNDDDDDDYLIIKLLLLNSVMKQKMVLLLVELASHMQAQSIPDQTGHLAGHLGSPVFSKDKKKSSLSKCKLILVCLHVLCARKREWWGKISLKHMSTQPVRQT